MYADYVDGRGRALFEIVCAEDLEGAVLCDDIVAAKTIPSARGIGITSAARRGS